MPTTLELDPEYHSPGPDHFVWIVQKPDKTWEVQGPEFTQRRIMQAQNAKDIAICFSNFAGRHKGRRSQVRAKLLNGEQRVVWTFGVDVFPWD